MPAMRLFGRRWAVASDDAPLFAAPVAAFQAVWAALLGAALGAAVASPGGCAPAEYRPYVVALGGLLATAAVCAALAAWLTVEGLKGGLKWLEGWLRCGIGQGH
jgi:hypothetical protein